MIKNGINNGLSRIIRRLGRKGYRIDNNIGGLDLIRIAAEKGIQLLRGYRLKPFFKKAKGPVFVGKRSRLKFKRKISLGRTVYIGDHVEINALSKKGVKIGNNVSIHRGTIIDCTCNIRHIGEGIEIGDNVGISQNCYFQVRGNIRIGNNVIFGPGAMVFSETHRTDRVDSFINEQGEIRQDVIIEDGAWIGAGAIILGGVKIGANSIVAAGTVVSRNVAPYEVVGGVPAVRMFKRKENQFKSEGSVYQEELENKR
jgi:acetyltransferase-like isoleucine patch superfamily enzyme